jgi:phosphodiesterase/alkaline phosphatase D-like protein
MRRLLLPLAVLGLTALVPASASAAGFSLGVAAADVSSSSAILWAHATSSGPTTLEVAKTKTFGRLEKTKNVSAAKSHDNAVQANVTGLKSNTKYFYRWRQGTKRSAVGTFKTAPSASSNATVKFGWSGDADAQAPKGSTTPFYNRFEVYKRMQAEGNAFNFNFGDTIYSDTEVGTRAANGDFTPAAPTALTVKAKWAKYKQNLALTNLSNLRGSGAIYNHWDDHEFINDFTKAEHGSAIYKAGVAAFRDYMPVTYSPANGIYPSARPRPAPTTSATIATGTPTSGRPRRSRRAARSPRSTRRCPTRRSRVAWPRSTIPPARCSAARSSRSSRQP